MVSVDTSNYGVYVATRNDTGEVIYVGCSWKTGIKKRLRDHKKVLKANRHYNSGLQKFWNAKGLTFTHVVECLPIKCLVLAFEKGYGAQFDFKDLVNVNPLGIEAPDRTGCVPWNKGKKRSNKTKAKISETMINNGTTKGKNNPMSGIDPWNKGRKYPGQSERMTKRFKDPNERIEQSKRMIKVWEDPIFRLNYTPISGENHYRSKITVVIARTIKFLLFYTTLTHQEIADGIPGVTKNIVDKISVGKSWKKVKLHNQRFYNV
jgi:hypothetical protein